MRSKSNDNNYNSKKVKEKGGGEKGRTFLEKEGKERGRTFLY